VKLQLVIEMKKMTTEAVHQTWVDAQRMYLCNFLENTCCGHNPVCCKPSVYWWFTNTAVCKCRKQF